MNRTFAVTATALMLAFGTTAVNAADVSSSTVTKREARATLQQIHRQVSNISEGAVQLNLQARENEDADAQVLGLMRIRADINRIGQALNTLNSQRASLSDAQLDTLEVLQPQMHQLALASTKTINMYNANKNSLYATGYIQETRRISEDAKKAADLLKTSLDQQSGSFKSAN